MQKIIHGLDIFNHFMETVAKYLVDVCIATQIVIVFCGVIWRYFLNSPLTWVDELAALLLVLIAFLGCYIALQQDRLARIELFLGRFKNGWKRLVYVISELITLSVLVIVVIYGTKLFLLPTSLKQTTPGMYIPLWIFYGMIPLTFGLCGISTVTKILHYIFDKEEATKC